MKKLGQVGTFLDLIKFAHSVFALPFALVATVWAFRAAGVSVVSAGGLERLGLILVCMVAARTWAMTFNRLADRRIDADNPRTARRPSVTGAVTPRFMRGTMAVSAAVFVAGAAGFGAWWGNWVPVILAVPVLMWLAAYSLTKRFTAFCHFWLGASLGMAPVSAWVAIAPSGATGLSVFDARGFAVVLLGVGVTFWVAGFDILYALQDEGVDKALGLHSVPATVGRRGALWVSRLCHVATAGMFFWAGVSGGLGWVYWVGYGAAVGLLLVEQSLVSEKDISRVNVAFMTANGVMGIVFGGLAIAELAR